MCDWKFQPGRIVVTRAAVQVLLPCDMFAALARHLHVGNWDVAMAVLDRAIGYQPEGEGNLEAEKPLTSTE